MDEALAAAASATPRRPDRSAVATPSARRPAGRTACRHPPVPPAGPRPADPPAQPQVARPRARRRDRLTIEAMVAVEPPREPRLSADGRTVAWTVEAAGARQVFVLPLRAATARQVTASEKDVSDPQWSPDGSRLAYVRDGAIWIIGADGSRPTVVTDHPAGSSAPRWSPDGRRIAFLSRRRGWDQVWVVDAPLPRRGRPPAHERAARAARADAPRAATSRSSEWSPDGTRLAVMAQSAAPTCWPPR